MKKTGCTKRMMAMLLVIIMTVQLLPLNVLAAYGELKSKDTGIKVNTLKQEDAINWPIKIYDYLNDGMLFEYDDSMSTDDLTTSQTSYEGGTVPYGGGEAPPVTELGYDFTYGASNVWNESSWGTRSYYRYGYSYQTSEYTGSPWYYYKKSDYGGAYTVDQVDPVDYQAPMHLHVEDNDEDNTNWNLNASYFSSNQSTGGNIRYLVLVYRAEKVKDNYFQISISENTSGYKTSSYNWGWIRQSTFLDDSTEWTYKVFDLKSLFDPNNTGVTYNGVRYIWFSWLKNTTSSSSNAGFNDGGYCDISHIAYFDNKTEAENYGKVAAKFDNNPGEYLRHSASYTATTTTVTYPERPDYVASLYYYWKQEMTGSTIDMENSFYGLDMTTHSVEDGAYVNGYVTHSYYTWKSGATSNFSYYNYNTGITTKNSFKLDQIGVEEMTQSNGASYVRLTTTKPSRMLLTRLREDLAMNTAETYVPITSYINWVVMVYRANGLTAEDQYALWAQGYDNDSLSADQLSAGKWGYAGLIPDDQVSNWANSSQLNPQDFEGADGQWAYAVIPLTETIAGTIEGSTGGDSYMENVSRLARMGMYLPQLSNGKSLDLAYVVYFGDETAANNFGEAAKTYLNTPATTKETTKPAPISYGSSRFWNRTGNNKGFGMLYATGHGNWSNGSYGGTNTKDDFGFDTWMIGYHTSGTNTSDTANSLRKNPMNEDEYYGATNSGNQIYYIGKSGYDISSLDYDGYQLLEKLASGVMTTGLLEGSLRTMTIDGIDYRLPVYRQETVEYIAYLLLHALRVPKRDTDGNYNTSYVAGAKSTQFGGVDLNGDGEIGMINLDGDSRSGVDGKETDEASVDLATALRYCLGITFDPTADVGSGGKMGTYAETLAKSEHLIGSFSDCRRNITTTMDAAYYMLNSLFVGNSFNQAQDDYYYLNMPMAELDMTGRTGKAYVFDAGFTTGAIATTDEKVFADDGTNKNAVVYDPMSSGGTVGTGTISLAVDKDGKPLVTGKTFFGYDSSSWTNRFPFLPVTDAEGDYAGGTYSYAFWDDQQRVYHTNSDSLYQLNADGTSSRRNYNYALVSNGEFVYKESDNLFFDFEGDDDVYLFINGELVLDIGGAHGITSVSIDVNDYVTAARAAMKPLSKYGYTAEMSIENFDQMITGDTLQEYIYDDTTGKITGTKTVENKFTDEQIAEYQRWARLDLTDGEICKFDFYYMERKSWGANMRIVTNMHITDPTLDVDKTAYQFENEIEYGGVIDPTSSLEYNFSLNNSGNTKLYNLTFQDDVIGVKLDPTNGLTVATDYNGVYVLDATGHTLEAKDLSAVVEGYNAAGEYVTVNVTFPEVNGDGGQTALKNFLHILKAEGTDSTEYEDAEVTRAGMGLWVGAKVTIKGIHYMLTTEQTKAGSVQNTVYVSATTRRYSTTVGNKTLYSDAEHLVYTSGFPVHYQWAGHNIFLNLNTMLKHAFTESTDEDSQLYQFKNFFTTVSSKLENEGGKGTDYIYYDLCDKYGRVGGYYPYQTEHKDAAGNEGYLINYDEPGVYTFYMLLYLKNGAGQNYQEGYNASQIAANEYAIIRSQVYVADVKDSVYVLDYGLSTESLDANGELFKNDTLFGPYGTIRAKLMGVTTTQPSYLDPVDVSNLSGTNHSRIDFSSLDLSENNTVQTGDGIYKVNLAIPETGKLITYDATTGQYSLTGVGTVTITAVVPTGESSQWGNPHLYYWYDDGTTGPAWPGTVMKSLGGGGKYEIDIPADVSKVIINNGSGAVQTVDLSITPGLSSIITVTEKAEGSAKYNASIETILRDVTAHAKSGWSDVKIHYLSEGIWQVAEKTGNAADTNGYYTFTIPGNVTSLYLSDGGTNRTAEQTVYAGREVWLEAGKTVTESVTENEVTTNYYSASIRYTLSGDYIVHASVPNSWKDDVYVYYWYEGQEGKIAWPGVKMTKGDFGWYTFENVPADMTHLIINDGNDGGNHQTVDLTVTPGLETWVTVNNQTVPTDNGLRYTASVAYGSESGSTGLTFTPKDFMDQENSLWMALTVHSTSANPTAINTGIDIHNEVQMYKKITVLPATVVYYEDDFAGINYNKEDVSSKNSFVHHGAGSGRLSQSVDQDQPYGQDAAYQDDSNSHYSGGSEYAFKIMDTKQVAYFTFKGTGFELISRTNAIDSASTVVRVYEPAVYAAYAERYAAYEVAMAEYEADTTGTLAKPVEPTKPEALRIIPVITQFDHGNDGGKDAIDQVPTVRVKNLTYGEYTVELSGMPTHTFDENFNISGTLDTYLYIDGLRIYQPMGDSNDLYSDAENGAEVKELRDLIVDGIVAVGTLNGDTLQLSTGTVTWTESLFDSEFDPENEKTYESTQVGSTDDYLIQGPNNEVYMAGNDSNSALVFYVKKQADSTSHALQIAVRALDYAQFYGLDSGALDAQLQYGVLQSNGTYAWKNLVRVVSGTEQYYTVPFEECPMDSEGRYQIVLRAVNAESGVTAMVSYTSVKLKGLNIEKVKGVGEGTVLYYQNGMLIRPDYYLIGTINGVEYNENSDLETMYRFENGKVTLVFEEATKVAIRRELNGVTKMYNSVYLDVPAGEVTIFLKQTEHTSLYLDVCLHTWDEGYVSQQANCTDPEVKTFTCTQCGHTKDIAYATNGEHSYVGGVCEHCGIGEPAYYLIGNINGADYEGTDYLFVDGKLVITFTQGSYVYIRGGKDNLTYMTDGWLGMEVTSAALYNSESITTDDKLFAPGRVEVTFTLEVNDDGTLTLSYTTRCIAHDWGEGQTVKEANCTEAGAKLYTCTICGETKTETIEAKGHDYGEDGVCSVCGDVLKRTIYFRNPENWVVANIWAWSGSEEEGNVAKYTGDTWPGDAMNPVEGEDGLYSYEVPLQATYVIFSANGTNQTATLEIPSSLTNEFDYSTGKWKYPDYYMVGFINGADYGYGDQDYSNMGVYKFVDGKLVATFTAESYVFIKTTQNADWFMFQSYCTTQSGTLYNTSTGAGEKMRVPGNVEVTFTLVANDDGTLTLSYTTPCAHEWNEGEITTAPNCITEGVKTFICKLCGGTKTEPVAATGIHSFTAESPDDCTVCEADRTYTVYFQNDSGLENVYIWAWDSETNYTGGTWPGAVMTKVNDTGLYSYELSVKATGLLFNDGVDGMKTADLVAPDDGGSAVQYNSLAGTWTDVGVSDIVEYCLMGWIEGADSGTGGDYADTDNYRFAGAYVVTFNQDAYIAVKSVSGSDNVNWYWTNYTESSVCTFQTSGTESNKQKVPAGTYVIRLLNQGNGSSVMMRYDAYSEAVVATVSMTAELANAAAAYSPEETVAIELPDAYFIGDEEQALNLLAINQQMSSNIIIGEDDPEEPSEGNDSDTKELMFSSTNIELSNDISVNYKTIVPEGFTNAYMVVEFNGTEKVVTEYSVDTQGRYCFKFSGITPQKMGDNICATLYATYEGKVVSVCKAEYSVRTYCTKLLQKDISKELRQLVSDLLVYGEKAQICVNYRTEALVTDGLELSASEFTGLDASANQMRWSGTVDENNRIKGVSLYLHNKVDARFGVVVEDPETATVEVTLNGKTTIYHVDELPFENDRYYVYYDGVTATTFDDVMTVVLKVDGEQVGQTLRYSVNSYLYQFQNVDDAKLRDLIRAIYNYGKSAKDLVTAQ